MKKNQKLSGNRLKKVQKEAKKRKKAKEDPAAAREAREQQKQREARAREKFVEASRESASKLSHGVDIFFKMFGIIAILRTCGICRRGQGGTGISAAAMFRFLFEQAFRPRSAYQMEKDRTLPKGISTSSLSRFLSHSGYNWEKFLSILGSKAHEYIAHLNDPGRPCVLAIDDTDYDRNPRNASTSREGKPNKKKSRAHKGSRTELVAKKYDHARHIRSKGFRMLTVIWSDAATVIPLAFSLLSSQNKDKIVGDIKAFKHNSLSYRRRALAVSKTTEVMITLIKQAVKAVPGIEFITADRWFSDPLTIYSIMTLCQIHVITPLKHAKTKYRYNGEMLTIAQIRNAIRKKPGNSRWHASATIQMRATVGRKEVWFDVKVVFVHNRSKRGDWIAFACTDTSQSEEDIITRYAIRFDIEHMFRSIKLTLGLKHECHAMSYDAISAHATIVLARYLMLAIERRKSEDQRTFGDLFFETTDQLNAMDYGKALHILAAAIFDAFENRVYLPDEMLDEIIRDVMNVLPSYIKEALAVAASAQSGISITAA